MGLHHAQIRSECVNGGGVGGKNNSNKIDLQRGRENQTLIFDVNNDHKSYGLLRGSCTDLRLTRRASWF